MIEMDKLRALLQKRTEKKLDVAYYVCFYNTSMYIFSIHTIIQYGKRCIMNCKGSTMAFRGYVPKDVVLVPTDKATKYIIDNGKWVSVK